MEYDIIHLQTSKRIYKTQNAWEFIFHLVSEIKPSSVTIPRSDVNIHHRPIISLHYFALIELMLHFILCNYWAFVTL